MRPTIKQAIRPVAGPIQKRLHNWLFPGSAAYWEKRYAGGETSGAGSYGVLAKFKAEVLNGFVREHGVRTVMEFGCGDGNQLSLADYMSYMGLDVAPTSIDLCSQRFASDPTKSFYIYDTRRFIDNARIFRADLTLSLDVIYHLVEDEIFEGYMRHLFAAADRNVIIYATNYVIPDPGVHVRHRNFTPWVSANLPDWRLAETIKNAYRQEGGIADFFVFERVTVTEATG
jgi:hypothetical protein